jgi:hypothetical protein
MGNNEASRMFSKLLIFSSSCIASIHISPSIPNVNIAVYDSMLAYYPVWLILDQSRSVWIRFEPGLVVGIW